MRHLFLILAFLVLGVQVSFAQSLDDTYATVHLVEWPSALYENASPEESEHLYPYDLLAAIDTLALGYAYGVEDEYAVLDFSLIWTPGPYGVYDDELVRYNDLPGEVVIAALDLRADVAVNGAVVADLVLSLDSLVLRPAPEQFYVTERGIPWDNLFTNTNADDARAYVAAGFVLRNLEILRIAFASYQEEADDYEPRYPTDIGVYPPRIGIWVDWLGPARFAGKRGTTARPRTPREGIGRTETPYSDSGRRTRGETSRTPTTDSNTEDRRTTRRTASGDREATADKQEEARKTSHSGKAKKKKEDKEDDDDKDLLPGALVGVAAIGVVAFAGGTIGYFGNTETPIGLTSGFVQGKGGALLQGAVNEAVLGEGDEPEQAIARIMSFYDAFNAPIKPAVGLGVLLEENGDEVDLSPSIALGAVGSFGPVLLYGGYDVAVGSIDFGLAFNFRHKRR